MGAIIKGVVVVLVLAVIIWLLWFWLGQDSNVVTITDGTLVREEVEWLAGKG